MVAVAEASSVGVLRMESHQTNQMTLLLVYLLRPGLHALESMSRARGMAVMASHIQPPPAQSPSAATIIPKVWLEDNNSTPAVRFMRGTEAPTALSWMRRRGPAVHHGLLFKLFRARAVSAE